jgi:hypothetical protein
MTSSSAASSALASLALLAGIVLGATPARADANDVAESAFREARQLMKEGRIAEACPRFEASYGAVPALGALLNLAICHQQLGRTASAYAELRRAEEMARQRVDSREAIARDLADALEPRLTRLLVEAVEPTTPGLIVLRGSTDVTASLGVAIAVDPGEHEVEASAPGRVTWTTTVKVGGEGQTISVRIPGLPPAVVAAPTRVDLSLATPRAAPTRRTSRRNVTLALGGGALLVGSTAIVLDLWAQDMDADSQRAADLGDAQRSEQLHGGANARRYTAEGLGAVAIGLAGTALYLWLADTGTHDRVAVTPVVTPDGAHAVVRGAF